MQLSIIDKWGKKRRAERIICQQCQGEVVTRIFSNRPNKFCSRGCAAKYRGIQNSVIVRCHLCSIEYRRPKSSVKKFNFCSRVCKESYQSGDRHPNWDGGRASYRERARKAYGLKCAMGAECILHGVSLPSFAFDVDHIDSNRDNGSIENLQVLCMICHRKKTMGL